MHGTPGLNQSDEINTSRDGAQNTRLNTGSVTPHSDSYSSLGTNGVIGL